MKTEVKRDSQKLNRIPPGTPVSNLSLILYRKLNTKEFEVIQLWFSKIWFKNRSWYILQIYKIFYYIKDSFYLLCKEIILYICKFPSTLTSRRRTLKGVSSKCSESKYLTFL